MCIYVYAGLDVWICVRMYMSVCVCMYRYVYVCVCIYINISIYIGVYVGMYICIYLGVHICGDNRCIASCGPLKRVDLPAGIMITRVIPQDISYSV